MSVSYIEKDNRRHMYREANFIKNPLKALQVKLRSAFKLKLVSSCPHTCTIIHLLIWCYFNYCHFVTFLPFVQKAASSIIDQSYYNLIILHFITFM
ncbi:putative dimethyladenosine transferase [Trichinella spiralis]|uniref:putative dimethyladenosine transferase n=1 Tax=Trichinella spiralis TaxID=6334 RepID=UPI0001EFDF5A|nr:putative dimethyladenosine transferase [Trichinella spiralis]